MSQQSVLVVEDDAAIRRGLVDALEFAGYAVLQCADGTTGLQTAMAADWDLALLDIVLPGVDGLELLREIRRAKPSLPVILVTARGAESERVLGLTSGADDYVVKPFSARELLARVEAVLRRSASRPERVTVIRWDDHSADLGSRQVYFSDGSTASLSEKEAAILGYLAGMRGQPVSREHLLERVWGLDPHGIETRTVDMHIARLREKLADRNADRPLVVTVRAKGYMLAETVMVEKE